MTEPIMDVPVEGLRRGDVISVLDEDFTVTSVEPRPSGGLHVHVEEAEGAIAFATSTTKVPVIRFAPATDDDFRDL